MTEQEKQLIEGLASRIHNAPAPEIDREADAIIRSKIGSRPDALYILTQTVLVQEIALNQAKAQIEELNKKVQERSPQERSGSGSFLGSPAPSSAAPPAPGQPSWWARHTNPQQQPAAPSPPPSQTASQPYYPSSAPPPQQPASGGMFSGFLRNAATTAAGVVAGEVAFSALSGIFGHHSGALTGGASGFLGGGGAAGISPGSETIINNYYDSPTEEASGSNYSGGSQFVDPGMDDADTADTADTDDSYDDADDTSLDDSSLDDSGSYDDGGGDSYDV